MKVVPWNVPIKAEWARANELRSLLFDRSNLVLVLVEEETKQTWKVVFESIQAFRVTTEECSGLILEGFPDQGGFFEVKNSPWVLELGKGEISFLDQSRHFVVFCYDEVVEVVAYESHQNLASK